MIYLQLGYVKDFLALFLFSIILIKLYYLTPLNLNESKKEIMIYLLFAFLADSFFSIFSKAHTQIIGINFHSIVFFILIILFLLFFIYYNIQYL